jgi:hypothetical protein
MRCAQAGGSLVGGAHLAAGSSSVVSGEVQWSTESDGYAAGAQAQAMHLHFMV